MPRLMKASAWAKREFSAGSIPDSRTIKRWIENGRVKGRIIDSSLYVFENETFGVKSEISATVDALIAGSRKNHGSQAA